MSFRFLLDENVARAVGTALRRRSPDTQTLRVGDGVPIGAPDSEVLAFAEEQRAFLVTKDRRTMPLEIAEHQARGGATWGVALLRRQASLGEVIADLVLIAEASQPEEWRDVLLYVPLTG
ncbi:MAG: DUF5615 family PIN-like protein [Myxococcota bacterium]